MKSLIKIILLLLFILLQTDLHSQLPDSKCAAGDAPPITFGIPHKSPAQGEFLRALIIYVTFPNDSATTEWNIWPPRSRPSNPYTSDGRMIDHQENNTSIYFMDRYSQYTYSDFFCEMSLGQYDFIGDEYHIDLPQSSEFYRVAGYTYGSLNNLVLQLMNLTIDYTRYDKWRFDGTNWVYDENGNGTTEMVIINYRNIPNNANWGFIDNNPSAGGIDWLGTTISLDNKNIEGVTALGLLNRTTRTQVIVEHEVCHRFFGHTSLGLMTPGHGGSSYQYSPHERSYVEYITPTIITPENVVENYTLGDYIETGAVLKIQIPNSVPNEYFWIANHQKKSVYDGLSRGSNQCWVINRVEQDPYCAVGKGVFIYHKSADTCFNNSWLGYQNGLPFRFYRPMEIENADGKYSWSLERNVVVPELAGTYPIYKTIIGDRATGRDEYAKYVIDREFAVILNNKVCGEIPDYSITFDDKGDGLDAYNVAYDEIFSPYSNPATNSCENPSTNSGLTVVLQNQNSTTGAITLKVYFNDAAALLDLPPSKPKNVKVTKDLITQTSYHPKIKWDANIEPDFVSATYGDALVEPKYEIYRGYSENCNTEPAYTLLTTLASNVTEYVDNSATLYFADEFSPGPGCNFYETTYSYKIVAKDNRGSRSLNSERGLITGYIIACFGAADPEGPDNLSFNLDIPKEYKIYQNYPNPFNPSTNIQYDLPFDNFVTIKIYDVLGKEIMTLVNEFKQAGSYIASFNGSNLPSGIYYYKINAGNFDQVRKMILLK